MDSFEINKIVAAILMVALLLIGIGKVSDVVFHVKKPETPGYAVEVEQVSNNSIATNEVTEEVVDIAAAISTTSSVTSFVAIELLETCSTSTAYPGVSGFFTWKTTSETLPIPINNRATIKIAATILLISKESILLKFNSNV